MKFVIIMNMRIIITISFFAVTLFSFSQYSTKSKKAIKLYEKSVEQNKTRNIDGAIALLEQAIDVDSNFVEAHYSLAEQIHLFYSIRENQDAKITYHYEKVVELTKPQSKYARVYYQLGKIYYSESKFEKALSRLELAIKYPDAREKYLTLSKKLKVSCEFAKQAVIDSLPIVLEKLPQEINFSTFHSYPVLMADNSKMVYTVKAGSGRSNDENIYISEYKEGKWLTPTPISSNINTSLNEGTATISGDGKTLVFTACNRRNSYGGCDLYITSRNGNEWEDPKNMGKLVNSHGWDSGPSLSVDGRTLYFSSRRETSLGKADIFITYLKDNGYWTKPVNAGPIINTKEEDVTPFIHANGKDLYFASTGHVGMGGYDLFKAVRNSDSTFSKVENLGYPINTQQNEGAIFITSDYTKAYYEKVTKQGMASYGMLYSFDIPEKIKPNQKTIYVKGRVYDANTKQSLKAEVELYDLSTGERFNKVSSDSVNGDYLFVLNEGGSYAFHANKKGYLFYSKNFELDQTNKVKSVNNFDIPLIKNVKGAKISLRNVFFKSGKYDLNEASFFELDKVVELLKENDVKIEISGHTDDVGKSDYNKKLSLNRAEAVYNYLITKGVSPIRLTYIGYGESKPLVDNATPENRALNRRIEIKVK